MLGWMQRQVIQMLYDPYKNQLVGTSLVVQWLRLCAPNAGGMGLVPGWGTKILHATQLGQKKKKAKCIIPLALPM